MAKVIGYSTLDEEREQDLKRKEYITLLDNLLKQNKINKVRTNAQEIGKFIALFNECGDVLEGEFDEMGRFHDKKGKLISIDTYDEFGKLNIKVEKDTGELFIPIPQLNKDGTESNKFFDVLFFENGKLVALNTNAPDLKNSQLSNSMLKELGIKIDPVQDMIRGLEAQQSKFAHTEYEMNKAAHSKGPAVTVY